MLALYSSPLSAVPAENSIGPISWRFSDSANSVQIVANRRFQTRQDGISGKDRSLAFIDCISFKDLERLDSCFGAGLAHSGGLPFKFSFVANRAEDAGPRLP